MPPNNTNKETSLTKKCTEKHPDKPKKSLVLGKWLPNIPLPIGTTFIFERSRFTVEKEKSPCKGCHFLKESEEICDDLPECEGVVFKFIQYSSADHPLDKSS